MNMGEDKRVVVQAAIFKGHPKPSNKPTSHQPSIDPSQSRGQGGIRWRLRRTLQVYSVGARVETMIGKARYLLVNNSLIRKPLFHKTIGALLVLYMVFNTSKKTRRKLDDDIIISSLQKQPQLPAHQSFTPLSSFLDMSWSSWGKDTTQFETLLPPSEIDFSIDKRLPWVHRRRSKHCDDILLFMPYVFATGGNGQGSQLNSYILAATVSTFLNKALVILEPPRELNLFQTGSQFGCPLDAFEDRGEFLLNKGSTPSTVVHDFPDGLLRLIQHPRWISRGCSIPTCDGKMGYNEWDIARQDQNHIFKDGMGNDAVICKNGGRNIKVMPVDGHSLRTLFIHVLHSKMTDRSSANYDPEEAYNWVVRLGAKPHEAELFTTLSAETEIWDFLSALKSRSGLLRFQPWIARDVALYIKSSKLPIDVSYDAIHVRRGDKLIREAKKEVNKYWVSKGYENRNDFPTNYIPFSHYLEQSTWTGEDHCKRIKTHGTVRNSLQARLVYIATDDPITVRKEIDELPKAKNGDTIINDCHRLTFIFSPAAHESSSSFHLNSKGFHDDCIERYRRNVQAIADLMILTKSETFIGDFNSNWGRLVRNFRTVLNDNLNEVTSDHSDEPPVFVRDTVAAFGPEHPGPLGW